MKFVDRLLSLLSGIANFIGTMFSKLFEFLAKPLSYLFYFLDGIFYFFMQLFMVVVGIVKLFVGLLQLLGALIAGFTRTIMSFLTVDFNSTPKNVLSETATGIDVVMNLLAPTGVLTVVPYICLAIIWFVFVKQMIGLIGGRVSADA